MKAFFLQSAIIAAILFPPLPSSAEEGLKLPPPATTVYRQVLPDGRIIYSDEPIKGTKIDETIKVEPPIKGNLWTSPAGNKPIAPPKGEPIPVKKVPSPPKKSPEQADADVARAQLALEEAKKRQQAGAEPQEGERTATVTGSRLNEAYEIRQKWLARDVAQAEMNLKNAIKERDGL